MTEHTARLQRLEPELQAQVTSWRLYLVVDALQALRGVQLTAAVTMVAEIAISPVSIPPESCRHAWA